MNILIPPIAYAPRICDECPENDCSVGHGYEPPCFDLCSPHNEYCELNFNKCSAPNALVV